MAQMEVFPREWYVRNVENFRDTYRGFGAVATVSPRVAWESVESDSITFSGWVVECFYSEEAFRSGDGSIRILTDRDEAIRIARAFTGA